MLDEDRRALQAVADDLFAGMNVLVVGRDSHASRAHMDDMMCLYGKVLTCTPASVKVTASNQHIVRFVSLQSNVDFLRGFYGVVHLMPSIKGNERDLPRWRILQSSNERFRING